jgi:hypothetical protein
MKAKMRKTESQTFLLKFSQPFEQTNNNYIKIFKN